MPSGSRVEKWGMADRVLTEENFAIVEALTAWANDHGHSLLDLAFAWLLANPSVASVIAGATSPAQIVANAAAGSWVLSPKEADEVRSLVAAV